MNKDNLKSLLIRDKGFLKGLYDGPNPLKNKRILSAASDTEIQTLLKYLNFLTNGIIHINKDNYAMLKQKKKILKLRKYFEQNASFKILLNSSRTEKLAVLLQFATVYPNLLWGLFNLESF